MSETWQDAAQTIADEIVILISQKQHDYGKDNIVQFGGFGVIEGIFVIEIKARLDRL